MKLLAFECKGCAAPTIKRSPMQKYCIRCSEEKHLARSRSTGPAQARRRSRIVERGMVVSREVARTSLSESIPFLPDDGWMCAFKVPFTMAASKNYIWSLAKGGGHVFKRQQSRRFQDVVAAKAMEATRGFKIFQNKLWIDLFVQKPNNKCDAINVIDVVCDGLKIGLGIDDRWFCIKQVDWEIAKNDPQIFIRVYQRDAFDVNACSHCGRILALENFKKKKTTVLGVDRVCRECRTGEGVTIIVEQAGTEEAA